MNNKTYISNFYAIHHTRIKEKLYYIAFSRDGVLRIQDCLDSVYVDNLTKKKWVVTEHAWEDTAVIYEEAVNNFKSELGIIYGKTNTRNKVKLRKLIKEALEKEIVDIEKQKKELEKQFKSEINFRNSLQKELKKLIKNTETLEPKKDVFA